jgi:hypothetical protein
MAAFVAYHIIFDERLVRLRNIHSISDAAGDPVFVFIHMIIGENDAHEQVDEDHILLTLGDFLVNFLADGPDIFLFLLRSMVFNLFPVRIEQVHVRTYRPLTHVIPQERFNSVPAVVVQRSVFLGNKGEKLDDSIKYRFTHFSDVRIRRVGAAAVEPNLRKGGNKKGDQQSQSPFFVW